MSNSRIAALVVAGFFVAALALFQVRSGSDTETVEVAASATDSAEVVEPQDTEQSANEPEEEPPAAATTTAVDVEAPPKLGPVPELVNLDGWLQTEGDSFDTVKGEVTIVQFWTYSCYNCTNTIPFLQDIYANHKDNGLEIIGVHSPEFKREEDPVGIQDAADRLGVSWPIALDTEKTNFRSWQDARRFWPRTFVIDQNGEIRFDKIGEGKYTELEDTVAYLLENGA